MARLASPHSDGTGTAAESPRARALSATCAAGRPPPQFVLPPVVVLGSEQYVLSHAAVEQPRLLGDAGQRPVNRHNPSL